MPTEKLFQDYSAWHQNPANIRMHAIGIPLVAVSTLGILGAFPIAGGLTGSELFRLDAGTLAIAASAVFYLFLDWRLAIPFVLFTLGTYFFARAIPVPACVGLFVAGWVVQIAGHRAFERNRPAFLGNPAHLLVGPFWLFSKLIRYSPTES